MPTYSYRCGKCGEEFDAIRSIREEEANNPACPKCDSGEVRRVFRPFFAKTSRKS